MMVTARRCSVRVGLLVAVAALGVSACGSSGDDDTSSGSASSKTSAASTERAKAAVAPYTGKASAFPLDTKLGKRPQGATVAFMDCGTPFCALMKGVVGGAAKTAGVKLQVVKAGASAEAVNSAFNSVVENKPDAVINTALDPVAWQQALGKLKAAKIPITSTGIVNGSKFGLTTSPNSVMFGKDVSELSGRLLADWIFLKHGADTKAAFYWAPELAFMPVIRDAFTAEMKQLCPSCEVRAVKVGVATFGNTAPQKIVSDLQANPDTNAITTGNSEMFTGLPAALKTAGLKVTVAGTGGGPTALQYVKDGQQDVDLAVDIPVLAWTLVDAAMRPISGEEVPAQEAKGLPPMQFLTKSDITFDPSKGWTGYPDFPQRFSKLWGVGGAG